MNKLKELNDIRQLIELYKQKLKNISGCYDPCLIGAGKDLICNNLTPSRAKRATEEELCIFNRIHELEKKREAYKSELIEIQIDELEKRLQ